MSIHSVSAGGVCLYVCVIHFYVAESVTISSPKVGPHLVLTASVKPSLAAAAPTCCSNQSNIHALNLRRSTAVQTLMRYGLQAPPWASGPRCFCQRSSQQMKAWNSASVRFIGDGGKGDAHREVFLVRLVSQHILVKLDTQSGANEMVNQVGYVKHKVRGPKSAQQRLQSGPLTIFGKSGRGHIFFISFLLFLHCWQISLDFLYRVEKTEMCCFSYIDTSQGLNVQLKLLHWSFSLELKLSANADRW